MTEAPDPSIGLRNRLVFEPSGLEIACTGLTGTPLDEIVARWCCSMDVGEKTAPVTELRIWPDGAWRNGHENHGSYSTSGDGHEEKRFGTWKLLMRPGRGFDEVVAIVPTSTASVDFVQAIDLSVTHLLALQGGAMLHGTAFEIGGGGILAIGSSGSGKSTIAASVLSARGTIVSDDLLLAASLPSGKPCLATMRRFMVLREGSLGILSDTLRKELLPVDVGGDTRWKLLPEVKPSAFAEWTTPRRLWLVSLDRRLTSSRIGRVDQATALRWLVRATTHLFFSPPFDRERDAQIEVLQSLAESCPAYRIRVGRDLLARPGATLQRLLIDIP